MHTLARPNGIRIAQLGITRLPAKRRAKVRWIDHPINFAFTVAVTVLAIGVGMLSATLYLAK